MSPRATRAAMAKPRVTKEKIDRETSVVREFAVKQLQ
jgi:hypothetical protein